MKNKIKYIVFALVIILLLGLGYFYVTKEDKITTLNLFEKQWIEKNENNLIDMGILDNVPLLSYSGEGIILDFLDSLHKETNLSFNKISYKIDNNKPSNYSFALVDEVKDNNILIYEDNYVIVTKNNSYKSLDELKDLTIGVLNEDLSKVNNYLHNANVTYKTFENKDNLIMDFNNVKTNLDGIVLLKTIDLKNIIENNYKIAFNISDYKKYCVLTLGDINELNNILTKYYRKWSKKNYDDLYNKYLSKNYLNLKNVSDSENVKFRSKRYIYGFISNAPFDLIMDNKLSGINYQVLSNFSKLTNAEISYKKFKNIEDMVNAFNSNQIDLFYGINSNTDYKIDAYTTTPVIDNSLVLLKHSSNDKLITSIKSVDKVVSLENSNTTKYLLDNNITVTAYKNMEELIKNVNQDDVILLDLYNYNYYVSKLKNYVIAYQFDSSNNSYIVRDINDNKIFEDFLDFYLRFNDSKKFISSGLKELMIVNKKPHILKKVAIVLGSIVGVLLISLAALKLNPKKKNKTLSKEDKLRYIDSLTSLKNRNYLNDSMDKWDNNQVYPQTIVIVDLNNVTYINDNYGHSEGDEIIKQAANVLIVNQLPNSEIVRTNGNEFLIYLVEYDEKQVVSYMRKLAKELKELKHGFGAAVGYSMITDDIKTIDDAINEATIDMRNNKEESRE